MKFIHIQILRFVAATAVVIFHCIGTGKAYLAGQGTIVFKPFEYGGSGVDLFFVISGFIIFYSTWKTNPTPSQFLRRRVERIVPIYWFLTILVVVMALVAPQAFNGADWTDLNRALKSLFFIAFTDGVFPRLFVGWSLEYEMLFYLSVGFLMFRGKDVWNDVLILFSILVIAGRSSTIVQAAGNYKFLLDPLLLEFAFGVLVAQVFCGRTIARPGLVAVGCACVAVLATDPTHRIFVFGLPSAALVFLAAHLSRIRPEPSSFETVLGRLGDASYSIYLIQVLSIPAAAKLTVRLWPGIPLDVFIVATATATVLAGYLLYLAIEKPALDLCRRIRAQPQPIPGAAVPPT